MASSSLHHPNGSTPQPPSARGTPPSASHTHGAHIRALAAQPWPHPTAPLLIAAASAVFALFLILSVAAYHAPAFPADRLLSVDIQSWRSDFFAPLVNFFGDLAGPMGAAIEYVIILTALLVFRLTREAICAAVSGLGAEVANIISNGIVARPRPPTYHGHTLFNLGSHSFPSGHTADALGLFGFLFYLTLLAGRAHPEWRPLLIVARIFCALYLLDVGVSRVLEGQHWPSDVAAGYLIGALTMLLGIALYHLLALRDAHRAPRQPIQP